MTYLDWAATALPRKQIITDSLNKSLEFYGNPSSVHSAGLAAKDQLNKSRETCAGLLNCKQDSIYFTSGGTESNNIVLLSFLKKHITGQIITSSIEHPSISGSIDILKNFGWKVKNIDPNSSGKFPNKKLNKSITELTKIVSLILVHNETGIIQDLEQLIETVRQKESEIGKNIHIHIDGVQAVGKTPINLELLDIDSFSISAHKFGGPRGIGLLYLKKSRDVINLGGGQESGIRPGTENIFGITAMTNCLEDSILNLDNKIIFLNGLMDKLIIGVRSLGISTIPKDRVLSDKSFVPNILSLTSPPLPGEVLARVLNDKGFMISTGSACSSNKKSSTKGILSMGISKDEGFSSFRVSIGRTTTLEDIDNFLKALEESIKELAP